MVTTKQQIEILKTRLREKEAKIDSLRKDKALIMQRENLIKQLSRAKNPRAFLRKEQTKKTLQKVGKLSWKGAKKTWNFLGRMAEEDQRAGRRKKRK